MKDQKLTPQTESRNLTEKEERVLVALIKNAEEIGDNGVEFFIGDVCGRNIVAKQK